MSYKPDEGTLMAYLYGELEGVEKEKVERYLAETPAARAELDKFQHVRNVLGRMEDKEVIAPPIVIDNAGRRISWNSTYVKTIISIAASLLLIMVVGRITNTRISFGNHEMKISFGEVPVPLPQEIQQPPVAAITSQTDALTSTQVQQMIDASLDKNNEVVRASLAANQQKLDASIRQNLAQTSSKMDELIRVASTASQDQIRGYVTSLQTENMQMVKDYLQLTSTEQKKYIENLLVDFSQYLQQQRNDDLMLMQAQMKVIEQNTDVFKQETEQILTGIVTNVNQTYRTIKN